MNTPWYLQARILSTPAREHASTAALLGQPRAAIHRAACDMIARQLGRGHDTFRQELRDAALDERAVIAGADPQASSWDMRVVTGTGDLRALMTCSADATLDDKEAWIAERRVSSHHVNLAIRREVVTSAYAVRGASLRPELVAAFEGGHLDPASFHRSYGDSFIASVATGGELVILFELAARSERERQRLSAEARDACLAFRRPSDLEAALACISTDAPVTARVYARGGPAGLSRMRPSMLIPTFLHFSQLVDPERGGAPSVIQRGTRSYREVGLPGAVGPLFEQDLEEQRRLGELLDRAEDLRCDLDDVQREPRAFGDGSEEEVAALRGAADLVGEVCRDLRRRLRALRAAPGAARRARGPSYPLRRGGRYSAAEIIEAVRFLLPRRGLPTTWELLPARRPAGSRGLAA